MTLKDEARNAGTVLDFEAFIANEDDASNDVPALAGDPLRIIRTHRGLSRTDLGRAGGGSRGGSL
jgi:hypothetical protein